jgi:hypothetical protein
MRRLARRLLSRAVRPLPARPIRLGCERLEDRAVPTVSFPPAELSYPTVPYVDQTATREEIAFSHATTYFAGTRQITVGVSGEASYTTAHGTDFIGDPFFNASGTEKLTYWYTDTGGSTAYDKTYTSGPQTFSSSDAARTPFDGVTVTLLPTDEDGNPDFALPDLPWTKVTTADVDTYSSAGIVNGATLSYSYTSRGGTKSDGQVTFTAPTDDGVVTVTSTLTGREFNAYKAVNWGGEGQDRRNRFTADTLSDTTFHASDITAVTLAKGVATKATQDSKSDYDGSGYTKYRVETYFGDPDSQAANNAYGFGIQWHDESGTWKGKSGANTTLVPNAATGELTVVDDATVYGWDETTSNLVANGAWLRRDYRSTGIDPGTGLGENHAGYNEIYSNDTNGTGYGKFGGTVAVAGGNTVIDGATGTRNSAVSRYVMGKGDDAYRVVTWTPSGTTDTTGKYKYFTDTDTRDTSALELTADGIADTLTVTAADGSTGTAHRMQEGEATAVSRYDEYGRPPTTTRESKDWVTLTGPLQVKTGSTFNATGGGTTEHVTVDNFDKAKGETGSWWRTSGPNQLTVTHSDVTDVRESDGYSTADMDYVDGKPTNGTVAVWSKNTGKRTIGHGWHGTVVDPYAPPGDTPAWTETRDGRDDSRVDTSVGVRSTTVTYAAGVPTEVRLTGSTYTGASTSCWEYDRDVPRMGYTTKQVFVGNATFDGDNAYRETWVGGTQTDGFQFDKRNRQFHSVLDVRTDTTVNTERPDQTVTGKPWNTSKTTLDGRSEWNSSADYTGGRWVGNDPTSNYEYSKRVKTESKSELTTTFFRPPPNVPPGYPGAPPATGKTNLGTLVETAEGKSDALEKVKRVGTVARYSQNDLFEQTANSKTTFTRNTPSMTVQKQDGLTTVHQYVRNETKTTTRDGQRTLDSFSKHDGKTTNATSSETNWNGQLKSSSITHIVTDASGTPAAGEESYTTYLSSTREWLPNGESVWHSDTTTTGSWEPVKIAWPTTPGAGGSSVQWGEVFRVVGGSIEVGIGVGMTVLSGGWGIVGGVGLTALGIDSIITGMANLTKGKVGAGRSVFETLAFQATGSETAAVLIPAAAGLVLSGDAFRIAQGVGRLSQRAWAAREARFSYNVPLEAMQRATILNYQGAVTRQALLEGIDGVTATSSQVVRAVREGAISLHVVSDRTFNHIYIVTGGIAELAEGVAGYAWGTRMYVRRSVSFGEALATTVHEGRHALDYLQAFIGSRRTLEARARFAEREFVGRVGLRQDFPDTNGVLWALWVYGQLP